MRHAPILLVLLTTTMASEATAQNLLNNGDFDSTIDGWSTVGSPEIVIQWTPTGNPDGGLQMWTAVTSAQQIDAAALSPCLVLQAGDHLFRGDALAQGLNVGPGCGINRFRYSNSNCSGSPATTDSFSNIDGAWTTTEGPFTVSNPTGSSYRIALSMVQGAGDTGLRGCTFDNVALFGPPPSSIEIPVLDRLGLAALAFALAVAALMVNRRT